MRADWLVRKGLHEGRPALHHALAGLGKLRGAPPPPLPPPPEQRTEAQQEAARYTMPFGKHRGDQIGDMPEGYLSWLGSSGAAAGYGQGLDDALCALGYDVQRGPEDDEPRSAPRPSPAQPTAEDPDASSSSGGGGTGTSVLDREVPF